MLHLASALGFSALRASARRACLLAELGRGASAALAAKVGTDEVGVIEADLDKARGGRAADAFRWGGPLELAAWADQCARGLFRTGQENNEVARGMSHFRPRRQLRGEIVLASALIYTVLCTTNSISYACAIRIRRDTCPQQSLTLQGDMSALFPTSYQCPTPYIQHAYGTSEYWNTRSQNCCQDGADRIAHTELNTRTPWCTIPVSIRFPGSYQKPKTRKRPAQIALPSCT